jgi:hypothetical protein
VRAQAGLHARYAGVGWVYRRPCALGYGVGCRVRAGLPVLPALLRVALGARAQGLGATNGSRWHPGPTRAPRGAYAGTGAHTGAGRRGRAPVFAADTLPCAGA